MTPRPRTLSVDKAGVPIVKTSLVLPEALWLKAKTRALEERDDFRGVIMKALDLYLQTPVTRGK
jgi:hypothetical protein